MATDVVMPQMGESIAEGTIVRWIKKVGDKVDRDEPLFEISTDKVDAEIPSPAAGVVVEIKVKEGETVPVNSVVALIGAAGEAVATSAPASAAVPQPAASVGQAPPVPPRVPPPGSLRRLHLRPLRRGSAQPPAKATTTEDVIRQRSSPLVRKIAQEHQVDISQISGTGIAGRVTKSDILGSSTAERRRRKPPGGRQARPAGAGHRASRRSSRARSTKSCRCR